MKLKMGEQNALLMSSHNSLVMVVNAAVGGGGKGAPPPKVGQNGVRDLAAGHVSAEAAVAAINAGMRI